MMQPADVHGTSLKTFLQWTVPGC